MIKINCFIAKLLHLPRRKLVKAGCSIAVLIFTLFTTFSAFAAIKTQKTTNINRLDLDPTMTVQVSAQVGGYLFDIQGLTSPWAQVEFYSTEGNISVTTLANQQGIFTFRNVLAPLQTGDFCFLSIDTNHQANSPLCFSAPPPNTKTIIKDIILSPSFTLEKGKFRQNEKVAASGRTFPNAQIKVFMFEENKPLLSSIFYLLSSKVFAREGPQLEIISSPKGNFSFNLPTHKSGAWRMFVGPKYKELNFTAKSNILEFKALSWWQWRLIIAFSWLLRLLKWLFNLLFNWKSLITLLVGSLAVLIYKIKRTRV